ncbi:MAG TPA: TonB-dependent receptor, partial [Candidatus Binataceae bacterium]|nr:TonB-dependent receptor [Candidatus Binataceae bacterium]
MMRSRAVTWVCALLATLLTCAWAGSARADPPPAVQPRRIAGRVTDALGKPIAGATVRAESQNAIASRTVTDSAGHFELTLAPGSYDLVAASTGFETAREAVAIAAGGKLAPLVLAMKARAPLTLAVISARLDRARNDLSPETGSIAYQFDQQAIHRLPGGQNTALAQVLQQAPGVSQDSYAQGQEQIHFNGENGGGIQYRINGVFVPEAVTSFGELYSPRFVQNVTLLTGVLPAQFGWRNEGVIDITSKDGCSTGGPDNDNFEFFGGQRSTIQPSFELGGCRGQFSYYVSGFYLQDDLGLQAPSSTPDPNHDRTNQGQGFTNLSWLIDPNTRLTLLAGTSVNYFQIPPEPGLPPGFKLAGVPHFPSSDVEETELEQSYYGALTLQGSIGERTTYQLSGFSRYYDLEFDPDPIGDLIYNGVAATVLQTGFVNGLQEDTSYVLDSRNTLRAGFYLSGETIELDDHAQTFPAKNGVQTSDVPIAIVDNHHRIAWLLGVYAQDEWRPLPRLKINFGARWDWMSAFVTQNQVSPRVGAEYQLLPGTTLHGGYARYFKVPPFDQIALETVQKFTDTTNAAPINSGSDRIFAERDDYFDAGVRQRIIEGLNAGVDGFYKFGHDQLDLAQLAGS